MSLLFKTLYRFVIAFLPRSNRLLISWLRSLSVVILESKKRKSVITSTFSLYIFLCSNGARCHDLCLFLITFILKLALLLSSFTIIKRLFISSSLSLIRVVSSACLRLLMFLLPVLIPACNSSSAEFLMMCSVYRLKNRVIADSPVFLLSQSWTNQLFHIRF